MIAKQAFWGLVVVTAALFATIYAASGEYALAIMSVGLGVMWLAADAKIARHLGTVFFLAFLALALIASLSNASFPLTLLSLSADLAAWDVGRFRARFAGETARDTRAIMEARHLYLLAVTICTGFLIGVLPVFIHLAIPFVIVCGVALLALLTLRQSMHSLRTDHDWRDQDLPP